MEALQGNEQRKMLKLFSFFLPERRSQRAYRNAHIHRQDRRLFTPFIVIAKQYDALVSTLQFWRPLLFHNFASGISGNSPSLPEKIKSKSLKAALIFFFFSLNTESIVC